MREDIKVIFLDVDGVLNSYEWRIKNREKNNRIIKCLDEEPIKILSKIVETTNAKIVLSSSWRGLDSESVFLRILKEKLEKFNMSIFSMTGKSKKKKSRGWEIRDWLKDNKHIYNVTSFVIIDDDSFDIANHKKTLLPYYIKTSFKDGLQEKHVDKILHVLNGGKVNLILIPKRKDPDWKSDKYWFRKFIQETIDE